jgi:hypothetical protein
MSELKKCPTCQCTMLPTICSVCKADLIKENVDYDLYEKDNDLKAVCETCVSSDSEKHKVTFDSLQKHLETACCLSYRGHYDIDQMWEYNSISIPCITSITRHFETDKCLNCGKCTARCMACKGWSKHMYHNEDENIVLCEDNDKCPIQLFHIYTHTSKPCHLNVCEGSDYCKKFF